MTPLLEQDITEICDGLGPRARAFSGRVVLVTGALGFLGRYIVDALLRLNRGLASEPIEVIGVDNLITAASDGAAPVDPHLTFIEHDVLRPFSPERPVDYVIYAAGIASPTQYLKWPLETVHVATVGLQNALELARRSGARMISFSSSEVYGDPDDKNVPTAEDYAGNVACLGLRACYGESKRLGETLVGIYARQFGVRASIVRPFNVYGPGMRKRDGRVIPSFVASLLARAPVALNGDGSQTRTFCYVTDAIGGALRALLQGEPGHAYNIGNPDPEISMRDLAEAIQQTAPFTGPLSFTVGQDAVTAGEPRRRCPDIGRARLRLGYQPRVPLHEGLRRFWSWASAAYR
jgi:UDP-glucuronate decarboxylase